MNHRGCLALHPTLKGFGDSETAGAVDAQPRAGHQMLISPFVLINENNLYASTLHQPILFYRLSFLEQL